MTQSPIPKVLIVDDCPVALKTMTHLLKNHYRLYTAVNGTEAIEMAKVQVPDLILLDVNLPDISGYEVCAEIKKDSVLSNIPIIFVTIQNEEEEELRGLEVGGIDYLIKPVNVKLTLARIKNHVALARYQKQLASLSMEDALTAIGNRRCFEYHLRTEWVRASRSSKPLSLILADIDYFKGINDTYGHPAGDDCIVEVARALKNAVRRQPDVVCRIGGDEFACLLPETSIDGTQVVVALISERLEELNRSKNLNFQVNLSLGIHTLSFPNTAKPKELVAKADESLYQVKKSRTPRRACG